MKQKSPNIVFILPDQWRRSAIGHTGSDPVITPHLDKLSQEGLTINNMVSNRPICTPYRAMLLTGQYPFKNGMWGNCNSKTTYDLDENTVCLSDQLAKEGYSCAYIGKWHLNHPTETLEQSLQYTGGMRDDGKIWDSFVPPGKKRHSFDYWYSYNCCDTHLSPHYWTQDKKLEEAIKPKQWSVEHECDRAIEYIKNENSDFRDPNKPFFLMLAPNPPHSPYTEVPAKYLSLYEDKNYKDLLNRDNVDFNSDKGGLAARMVKYYFAAISGIDEQLGRVFNTLDEQGLKEDTICIFTSDHGELMGSHNLMAKGPIYEESIGAPFIIRWPGKIRPGIDNKLSLNVPDLYPTLMGLIDKDKNLPEDIEGSNRADHILGIKEAEATSSLFMNMNNFDNCADERGVRTLRYTYLKAYDKKEKKISNIELYDRDKDPFEKNNLYGQKETEDILLNCEKELARWQEKVNDPLAKEYRKDICL